MSNLVSLPSAADPILAGLIDEYTALRRSGGPADPEEFFGIYPGPTGPAGLMSLFSRGWRRGLP